MSLGISAREVWCDNCKRKVLEIRRGEDVTRHCACYLAPDQAEAIARHAANRLEDEQREKDRLDKIEAAKERAAAERRKAHDDLREVDKLREEAQACWDRKARQCGVTMTALEHRGCKHCPKFGKGRKPREVKPRDPAAPRKPRKRKVEAK